MEENHHHHDHQASSIHELVVLITYMINHNKSHAKELKELAEGLKSNKQEEAYEAILKAIKTYDIANEELEEALKKVKK